MLATALRDQLAPGATTFLTMLADDARMEFPFAPPGGTTRLEGRDAVARYIESLGLILESMSAPQIHRADEGGTIVLEFSGVGRLAEDGPSYTQTYISVITLRDGRIARYVDYWNPLALLRALGAQITMPEATR